MRKRVISSAVEQLVYTEKVGGSIPSSPTIVYFIVFLILSACGKKIDLKKFDRFSYTKNTEIKKKS
jgi:hypothetical protein